MPSFRPTVPHSNLLPLLPRPILPRPRSLAPPHQHQLHQPPSSALRPARHLSTTPSLRAHPSTNPNPQRSAQEDRDQINTESNEYAKSGTDDVAAGQEEAAFDPNISDPQEAKKKAGEGNEVNPLDASPANPELSRPTEESGGGAGAGKKPSER